MNFLFLGDIMGRSGRNIVVSKLPDLIKKHQIDFVVANGENSAGGFGITQAICNELFEVGVDVITSGNHIWDQKETMDFIREEKRLLRPWNWGEQLEKKTVETDPYQEQIEELKTSAVQELSYDKMNNLRKLQDHQEFLYKLLTSKDSFVRKRVIDQNLTYLNSRLAYYLDKTGLPHEVKFLSDLTVEITELGRDLDFDNLSRGERNRLILSLCWAFRDVWEMLYHNINTMFIDELVDSGMDTAGVENAIGILKQIARERHKNIYLISHRDELQGRVNNVLKVTKENGFTSYAFTDVVE